MESNQRAADGRFVMVPGWLLDADPSGAALRVYCELARFGTLARDGWYHSIHPALATVAGRAGMSVPTVKRTVRELEKLGALVRESRTTAAGNSTSNSYRLRVAEPGSLATGGSSAIPSQTHASPDTLGSSGGSSMTPRGVTGDRGVGSLVTPNQEPINQEPMTKTSLSPHDAAAPDQQTRERDDPVSVPNPKEATARRVLAAAGCTGPDADRVIAYYHDKGPGWWPVVAKAGDLPDRIADAGSSTIGTTRAPRPPWCGQCDERTRMIPLGDDRPGYCPRCNPRASLLQPEDPTPAAEPVVTEYRRVVVPRPARASPTSPTSPCGLPACRGGVIVLGRNEIPCRTCQDLSTAQQSPSGTTVPEPEGATP